MKKLKIICLMLSLLLVFTACGNAAEDELRQEISELEQELENLQEDYQSTNEAFAAQTEALMLHDNLLAAYEDLYSNGVESIEALCPPDSSEDLGYVLSTGNAYLMAPFENPIDSISTLFEVCGAFRITSLEGKSGVFLYCLDVAPHSVPPSYLFLPIENAGPYSEETKEQLKWPYTLVEGATDIEGDPITDPSSYWKIDSVTEAGVYRLSAPGGSTESVDRSMLIWPDVETYGVYRIGNIG